MEASKGRSLLQIQTETIKKYLEKVEKDLVLDLAMKIYPVMSSQDPYLCLFMHLKKYVLSKKSKNASLNDISSEILQLAGQVSESLRAGFHNLLLNQPQFIQRLQRLQNGSVCGIAKNSVSEQKKEHIINQVQSKKLYQRTQGNNFALNQEIKSPKEKCNSQSKSSENFGLNQSNFCKLINFEGQNFRKDNCQLFNLDRDSQNPLSKGMQDDPFIDSNPFSQINFDERKISNANGTLKQQKYQNEHQIKPLVTVQSSFSQNQFERNNYNTNLGFKLNGELNPISNRNLQQTDQRKQESLSIDALALKKKLETEKLQSKILYFPPPLPTQTKKINSPISQSFSQSFQNKTNRQTVERYFVDQSSIRNLADKQVCLCQTSCENITSGQDTFYCVHCGEVYHSRCMRKVKQSKNCVLCHLKLLSPNKPVHQTIFVGVMKKTKKKHQIIFQISEDVSNKLKFKKDSNFKLQIRCFRLKPQTNNFNLFPDSCSIYLNGKQVKQFKPLHKQSSLKYRRDQPILLTKNFQIGQNKMMISQFPPSSAGGSSQRVQLEDHLIGIYLIEQQSLANTIQRIIRYNVTTLTQSKQLLQNSFEIGDTSMVNDEQEILTCEVIKIPLTCGLTTQKLKYPARGVFCRHFQCFDLRNYIMMMSSTSNPRWICPICKVSCYEYKVDCILTEILNNYLGCQKVEQLMLYKDGQYQVLDKDGQSIDEKGFKQKSQKLRNISELKIQDKVKRQRQKQAQLQLLKLQQQEQKKRKKLLQLPPEDQIVSLLSQSD